jgi:hypothetical protein
MAGTYDVQTCDWAGGVNNSWVNRSNHADMPAFIHCPAGSDSDAGLVVRSAVHANSTVPNGAFAHQEFRAVAGTRIVRVEFSGAGHKTPGSRYQVGLSDGNSFLWGWSAGNDPRVGWSAAPNHQVVDVGGASIVYFEALCASPGSCSTAEAQGTPPAQVDLHLSGVAVRLEDFWNPGFDSAGGWNSGWHGGSDTFNYSVHDNSGIKSVALKVDGASHGERTWSCNYSLPQPCPLGVSDFFTLDTKILDDGKHSFSIVATDAGNNSESWGGELFTDNTSPGPIHDPRVEGGEGWRSTNDFAAAWTNPSGQAAPIAAVHYRLCRADAQSICSSDETVSGAGIQRLTSVKIPSAADYVLDAWLEDAAGNKARANAVPVGHVRFDNVPPRELGFEPPASDNPLRLFLHALDDVSGLADGSIEIRRAGTGDWRSLPTSVLSTGIEARIDDTDLPDGTYDVRGHVTDRAGNERSTDLLRGGGMLRISLPVRSAFSISAGFERRRLAKGKGGKRRMITSLVHSTRTAFGRAVPIRGHLSDTAGKRVAGARLEIAEGPSADRLAEPSVVTTDTSGNFRYLLAAGPSRTVRVRYPGTGTVRPAGVDLHLHVRASSSIHARPRVVLNGGATTFGGRLRGAVPSDGKLVALQAYFRGGWRTFATPHADATGRWRFRYRFEATRGRVRYRFRVVIPREAGYAYDRGQSRSVAVSVRGL